jgi:two-component system OmpR family sensor kinase
MSLRGRLLAGMVMLVAAGLAVTGGVTYAEQRSFLLARVDGQVGSAVVPLSFALHALPLGQRFLAGPLRSRVAEARPLGLGAGASLPPGTLGELVGPTTRVVRRRTFSFGTATPPAPLLPSHLPLTRGGSELRLFGVSSRSGEQYRAAAVALGDHVLVVAVPLRETTDTLHRLVTVELFVGGAVILVLVAAGWLVIRLGLAPLHRMERAAADIAAGDLSRRVSPADGRTEVGRLGRALNEMLERIEAAFADRRRSEEHLRSFISDASHELRTPLSAIRGYAELFRLGAAADPETLARAMMRIEAEAARMGVLVEDLLSLAALDQSPDRPAVRVDVVELVEQAAEDARAAAPDRNIIVHAARGAVVAGDPDRLRQLLGNLTRNALVHTPALTPIELTVRRDDGVIVVDVRDHGPGLPAGERDRLFERFWRPESGRVKGPGGAGLGLAIARAVAQAHGGQVRAHDASGGGALFRVTLPAEPPISGSQQSLSVLTPGSYVDRRD